MGFHPDCPVSECEFSVRTTNCLQTAGLSTVGAVALMPDEKLLKLPHFGTRSLQEIRNIIPFVNELTPNQLTVLNSMVRQAVRSEIRSVIADILDRLAETARNGR